MTPRTKLRRSPSHAASSIAALSCGVMMTLLVVAFARVESWWPLRIESRLLLRPVSGLDWGAPWTAHSISAVDQQTAAFNQLGLVVLVLSVVGALVGVVSFVALSLGAASVRRREYATRAALGASPGELVLRLTGECVRLAGIAVLIGSMVGFAAVRVMVSMWPHTVVAESVTSQLARAGVAVLLTGTFAVLATVLFAYLTLMRGQLAAALSGGSRITATAGELQVRDALAVLQFAGVLVLLSGAFVLARESRPNLGMDSPARQDLYVARLELRGSEFDDAAARSMLLERLNRQIARIPGVRAETLASVGAWLGLGTADMSIVECGRCFKANMYMPFDAARVRLVSVMPGFFELLDVRVEQGRSFTAGDTIGAPLVAIVNRPLASASFEQGKPVGRAAQPHGLSTPAHVIQGAVAPLFAPVMGSAQHMDRVMYLSALQHPPRSLDVIVRADDAAAALAGLEQLGNALPPGAKLETFRPSETVLHELAAPLRFLAAVLAVLALIVLLLALHGSYALQHFRVLNLQRDLGVRLALGATPRMLTRHVLRGAFNLVLAGLVIGGFGALAAMRTVQLLVPTAPSFAPDLFLMISALLSIAAIVGALQPAQRAARIDPARVLAA